MMNYDVIIVGAGPAGLFAANELSPKKKVLLIDAGVDLSEKECKVETIGKCRYCKPTCHIIGGFGGAQFFEGTKLSIYPAGSGLLNFLEDGTDIKDVYKVIDEILEEHGKSPRPNPKQEDIDNLKNEFANQGIEMKYYNAQKVSKYTMNKIAFSIKDELIAKGVDIKVREQILDITRNEDGTFILETNTNKYSTKNVLFAVGRIGSRQLTKFADKLGIEYEDEEQEMEIGVRIEMPYNVFDKVDNIHNDLKLKMKLDDGGELRTFCQDYKGFITKCVYNMTGDRLVSSLDGHIIGTDEEGGNLSDVVNLAVHHRYKVSFPIEQIYDIIDKMSINKRPIVQSMKNFMNNTNEENVFNTKFSMPDVVEANINDYIPEETLIVLKDFIKRIDKVLPGFANDNNTVYAPSFEMGWKKFILNRDFQTNVNGIYIIGDATGHFRGAMQAMASGTLCADELLKKDTKVLKK